MHSNYKEEKKEFKKALELHIEWFYTIHKKFSLKYYEEEEFPTLKEFIKEANLARAVPKFSYLIHYGTGHQIQIPFGNAVFSVFDDPLILAQIYKQTK